jgi:DNA-binding transcriptional ArsR family regulator
MSEVTTDQQQQQPPRLDEKLALIISSEITVKVLVALVERAASPKEIADALRLKVPTVSHHVKKLERMGLVELLEEREVRGAVQHIYRAIIRPIVSEEEWEKLGLDERQRYSIWIVQMILVDLARSFEASLFDARINNHLSRTPLVVDEQGVAEISAIQTQALHEIIEVTAKSAERRLASGESGIDFIAAMMCFELPEPSIGLARRDPADVRAALLAGDSTADTADDPG